MVRRGGVRGSGGRRSARVSRAPLLAAASSLLDSSSSSNPDLAHFVAGAQAASHERRAMLGQRTPRYAQVVVGAGKIHMAVVACARL